MFLGLMTTAVGTQLHLSNEKELEAILRFSNDFIGAHLQQQHGVLAPARSVFLRLFILLLVKMSGLQKAVDEDGIKGNICLVPKRRGGLWFVASEPGL